MRHVAQKINIEAVNTTRIARWIFFFEPISGSNSHLWFTVILISYIFLISGWEAPQIVK